MGEKAPISEYQCRTYFPKKKVLRRTPWVSIATFRMLTPTRTGVGSRNAGSQDTAGAGMLEGLSPETCGVTRRREPHAIALSEAG